MWIIKTLILVIFCSVIVFGQSIKINIAVLDLDGTGINEDEVQFLSNRLRTELFETGKFNVLERDQMNAILNEQGFQQSGCTSVDCAVEIGQLLNVKQMVAGSIGKIEDIYSITLRLIDVQTGAIVKTATQDHSGKLSTMLTEVIPVVSLNLANDTKEEPIKTQVKTNIKKTDSKLVKNNGFVLTFIGGVAYLQYTNDINNLIDGYNGEVSPDLPNFSNHANICFEVGYFISQNWELKLGLSSNTLFSEWSYKPNYDRYSRSYTFNNFYLGFNGYFLTIGDKLDVFAGLDIGSIQMEISIDDYSETFPQFSEKWKDKYETTRFATKLTLGALYPVGDFKFGANLTIRIVGNPFTRTEDPIISPDLFEIAFPKEINASATQLCLIVSYDL